MRGIVTLNSNPISLVPLGSLVSGATAAKRIENHVSRIG